MRQRVRLRTPALAYVARALTVLLALILVYYGAMLVLLAAKASPHAINSISGYRSLYDRAAGLHTGDFTTQIRLIAGFGGLLLFGLLTFLALQELPHPYLARGDLELAQDELGTIRVGPRAIERVAETAAFRQAGVTGAIGRLGDDELSVSLSVHRARQVPDILHGVRGRIREALARHELPALPVHVTVTGYDRKQTRELS